MAATWSLLVPWTSDYQRIWLTCQLHIIFCWTWYGSTRKVQEFNKNGWQNAPSNKAPAGHLTIGRHWRRPNGLMGSWVSLGPCTAQWKRSQWNALDRNTTWAAGPMKCSSEAWFISLSFIFFFFLENNFYVSFYNVTFFCSSYAQDYLKHAVLVKVLRIKPNCVSVPLKIWSSPSATKSILKVCLHPFTLSALDNARGELQTQSLNKLWTYLAST